MLPDFITWLEKVLNKNSKGFNSCENKIISHDPSHNNQTNNPIYLFNITFQNIEFWDVTDSFCPIIFGTPFLNTVNARIDYKKDIVTIGLGDMSHDFNFYKFLRQPHDKELHSKDEIIGLACIAVPPNDPLEQYLLDHENDMFMNERREIDELFLKQERILKHNLPVEIIGDPPPPKGDPVFELKPLPDNLKYAYLDENKIYPVIISANLSEHEEDWLL